jgi:hypothetical protein
MERNMESGFATRLPNTPKAISQYGEWVCNPLAQHPEGNFPY